MPTELLTEYRFVIDAFVAGIVASFACGLGVIPLMFGQESFKRRIGLGYGFAAGLMFSASVYNLLLPALQLAEGRVDRISSLLQVTAGLGLGAFFLWVVGRQLTPENLQAKWFKSMGGRTGLLVFIAMSLHSLPEGVAVGVGYAAETHHPEMEGWGFFLAMAIAIHNIPEGLAVALPMRAAGMSLPRCFWFAVATSLPQPIGAVPAALAVWLFEPLLQLLLGFAAGAMIFLVMDEIIPDALETRKRGEVAWSFLIGFALMALVQVAL
ncbi:ZIP family metal transporter [Stratiformator vulcanicus]|uniref:Zinc transporter ZupT n=1 Tax=Stratiformator vulcanicus TaxID=2527980 RepID=A0A517QVN6_9PLAN|nr:ZIP family metal transporter [Stratiformator vulcanicus]QDT35668.1 Zinc transporter ZupT [Stratiformator vulcanicus]